MKNILLIPIAILFMVSIQSCNKEKEMEAFDQFYDKYKESDDCISFKVPMYMARLLADKEQKELLRNIDGIKLMIHTNDSDSGSWLASELMNSLDSAQFNDLMTVNDGGDEVIFKIREQEDRISELVLIVNEKRQNNLVTIGITGDITYDQLKEITKKVEVTDLDDFNF